MRRAVFADADGIVREDIDDGNFHEAGETHGWFYVVAKIEKCSTERAQTAETHSAHGGAHGVFADAIVNVAAAVLSGGKFTRPCWAEIGFVGFCQVGGAA